MAPATLAQYLSSLPPVTLDRLYTDPWVCHALLRVLPPVARLYALRLAAAHGALPKSLVDAWPAQGREASARHEEAVRELRSLRLADVVRAAPACSADGDGGAGSSAGAEVPHVKLHAAFGEQLLQSLGGGPLGLTQDATSVHGADKNMVREDQLEMCLLPAPPPRVVPAASGLCQPPSRVIHSRATPSSVQAWRRALGAAAAGSAEPARQAAAARHRCRDERGRRWRVATGAARGGRADRAARDDGGGRGGGG